jgi:hypothetical protein
MLPSKFPVLFGDFEASLSLPRGILSILVLVVALVIPLYLLFGKKNGPGVVASRKRDVVLILGECKAGKTVMFHQVRVVLSNCFAILGLCVCLGLLRRVVS